MKIFMYLLSEGERIPRGYGIAYYDAPRNMVVCYPIPFNLVANALRKLSYHVISPSLPHREQELHEAYIRGVQAGIKNMREHIEREYRMWESERRLRRLKEDSP